MPIYEYYCPDNHTVYQFYAKTLAQGERVPRCPDNPAFTMRKVVSAFAVTGRHGEEPVAEAGEGAAGGEGGGEDARMEAAMAEMEREFSAVDENDPKAMGRMMRRMAELTGEKIDGEMEEVVRKLEEGADPESLEEAMGGGEGGEGDGYGEGDPYGMDGMGGGPQGAGGEEGKEVKEKKYRFRVKRPAPRRDPELYDFE
jgi:hypothetical protein